MAKGMSDRPLARRPRHPTGAKIYLNPYIATMPIQRRSISQIKPYRANPRTHPQGQIDKLATLIQKYGFHDSHAVAIDEDGVVIWGHGRIEAAKQAGLTDVPVEVLTGLSETDKTALRIADNGIAEQSDWDLELLAKELEALNQDGYSLELLALDDSLLEGLGGVFDPGDGLGGEPPNFQPVGPDEQGRLDQIKPKELTCICPKCGHEFIQEY